jgi:hypothetical protein
VIGGLWIAYAGTEGNPVELGRGYDADLAGTLATGDVGIYDENTSTTAKNRDFDNLLAWAVPDPLAIAASQSIEMRHDSAKRENAAGTIYGDAPYTGARAFLRPTGATGEGTRVVAAARRNNVEQLPDDNIADSTTLNVRYTPRYLVVPRS